MNPKNLWKNILIGFRKKLNPIMYSCMMSMYMGEANDIGSTLKFMLKMGNQFKIDVYQYHN